MAGGIVARANEAFDGEYAEHVAYLRKQVPKGFVVVEAKPWVVIGNGTPASIEEASTKTVAWAHQRLREAFFDRDPGVVDIWLFDDAQSYHDNVVSMLGEPPGTPYGFANERGIFMNIRTGTGTLVHEMVHPLMRANFPGAPPWFHEGLASLYEQSHEVDGRIEGLPNWRLETLQLAIAAGRVPSFEAFMALPSEAFYMRDAGLNYAQARYLCYYLQQRGLLRKFYTHLREHSAEDPTGVESLRAVVDESDLRAFKDRWEAYVLLLTPGTDTRRE
jgi:hypothetical protein